MTFRRHAPSMILVVLAAAAAALSGCTSLNGGPPRPADLVGAAPPASLVAILTPHVVVLNKYGQPSEAELEQISTQMRDSISRQFAKCDYVVLSQERVSRWLSTLEQMDPPTEPTALRFGQRLKTDLIVFSQIKTRKSPEGRVDAQITLWIHDGKTGKLCRQVDWLVQGPAPKPEGETAQ